MQLQQPAGGRLNWVTWRPQHSALQPRQHIQYLDKAGEPKRQCVLGHEPAMPTCLHRQD